MICDPWIDRSPPAPKPPRVFKSDIAERLTHRDRRAMLKAAGKCIAGPLVGFVGQYGVVHGPVYKAARCERCWNVKADGDQDAYLRRTRS